MKLWILQPVAGLPNDRNPWGKVYDVCMGSVVRAEDEAAARAIAADSGAGDENYWRDPASVVDGRNRSSPWLDPSLSSCTELTADGPPGLLLMDFNAG